MNNYTKEIDKEVVDCEDCLTVAGGAAGVLTALDYTITLSSSYATTPAEIVIYTVARLGITVIGGVAGGATGKYIGKGINSLSGLITKSIKEKSSISK